MRQKPTILQPAVWSPLILSKLAYLVEVWDALYAQRTIINPCWHKAVRTAWRKTLLNHAPYSKGARKIRPTAPEVPLLRL